MLRVNTVYHISDPSIQQSESAGAEYSLEQLFTQLSKQLTTT